MHRRMSNLTKDKLVIVAILILIIWIISGAIYYIFADIKNLTEQEQINKAYTEQQVYQEIRYWQMWEYTENMSPEEYNKTFFEEAE